MVRIAGQHFTHHEGSGAMTTEWTLTDVLNRVVFPNGIH
jgi:hypothetical protein